jgi:hypothetical protein
MDPLQILIGILLRNKRVKDTVDKGINDFLDGFSKANAPKPTREQELQLLSDMVQQMNKPNFAETFESRGEYLNFVLATITQASYLKSTDVVLRDFYSPGYHVYFPRPTTQPSPVTGKLARAEPVYAAATGERPYHFFLVASGTPSQRILDALGELASDATESVDASTLRSKLAALGASEDHVLAMHGIGQSKLVNTWVFVSAHAIDGTEDIKVGSNNAKLTRESMVEDLEAFLNREAF